MDPHGKFDDVHTCNLSSSVLSNFMWFLNSSYGRSNLIYAYTYRYILIPYILI